MPSDQLPQTTNSYLGYLKFEKRYSRHTITSYQNDLTQFFRFLYNQFGELPLPEIKTVYVKSWLADLNEKKIAPRSINRKVSVIRSFFKYQLREGKVRINPASSITVLKTPSRLPTFLESKDVETLFRHVEFPDTLVGKTHRLILMLLYASGIRLSELINIKLSQIDFRHSSLKVLGKGNKERIIPIQKKVLEAITAYRDTRRKELEDNNCEFLLVNQKGKKLYPKYVYLVVKQYLSEVTTIRKKSPHILRHSFATHLTNNGADLNAVKELLGHSSLAATQVYTHNSIEKLKDIHRKAHPKA